jgi:hypothetical protein
MMDRSQVRQIERIRQSRNLTRNMNELAEHGFERARETMALAREAAKQLCQRHPLLEAAEQL